MNVCVSNTRLKFILLGLASIFLNLILLYKIEYLPFGKSCKIDAKEILIRKVVNPPQLTVQDEISLKSFSSSNKKDLADLLSNIVQKQIGDIQSPVNCSGWNFLCGHYNKECGFGCQAHHRVACLMISYALNLPLIHDEVEGWPYSDKWSDVFLPLGANCVPGPNTFRWSWRNVDTTLYLGESCTTPFKYDLHIEFPLSEGIPVARKLGDLVEEIHPNSFLWWVGQFTKYSLRLQKDFEQRITIDKHSIGFSRPVIGMHIRRTDKITEAPESHHEIEEYMEVADSLFQTLSENSSNTSSNTSVWSRKIFIASDDSEILKKSQKRYPEWNLVGFASQKTFKIQSERKDALYEIVRDALILSECDFVICGITSNVCRLLLEMFSFKHQDSVERVKSMDGKYSFIVQGDKIKNTKIVKLNNNDMLKFETP